MLLVAGGLLVMAGAGGPLRAGVLFTNLLSFDGTNAALPEALLLEASDGNFYGTTIAASLHGRFSLS